ncbi:MAG: hypothetical protein ACFCU5_14315 [Pleurocapsa sp.]
MDIVIQRRANIALHSLENSEQKQILKALERIKITPAKDLFQTLELKLKNLGQNLYIYRGNYRLRLILSIKNDVCTVEDIIARDKLDMLFANFKQQ